MGFEDVPRGHRFSSVSIRRRKALKQQIPKGDNKVLLDVQVRCEITDGLLEPLESSIIAAPLRHYAADRLGVAHHGRLPLSDSVVVA